MNRTIEVELQKNLKLNVDNQEYVSEIQCFKKYGLHIQCVSGGITLSLSAYMCRASKETYVVQRSHISYTVLKGLIHRSVDTPQGYVFKHFHIANILRTTPTCSTTMNEIPTNENPTNKLTNPKPTSPVSPSLAGLT